MTDADKKADVKVEDKAVVVDIDTKEDTQEKSQSNPNVEKATALGGMPKEDWIEAGHEEDDWKPAKTFLEYGEMIGKLRNQAKELNETKNALQYVSVKNKEVYEKGYSAALAQLRTEKRAALAEGDLVKVDQLEEKIDETKEQLAAVKATPIPKANTVDPEHAEWLEQNSWYNQPVMQKFADALAIEYIRVNNGGVSAAQVRDFVSKEVRKEFAHKFQPKTKGAPDPDGEGRGGASDRANTGSKLDSKLTQAKSSMSEQERSIMKTMMKSAGLSEKEYLQMYLA